MYTRNYNFCRTQAVDNGCSDERDLHSLTKLGDSKSLTQDADVKEIHDFLFSHHHHRWGQIIKDISFSKYQYNNNNFLIISSSLC